MKKKKTRNFFPRRIPEPKAMGLTDQKAFAAVSKKNYKRWIIPFVDDVLACANIRNGKIIDVACGPGLLMKELAGRSRLFHVFGIDRSRSALQMAKKNCRRFPNVTFIRGDISSLPFPNESFDVVISKDSFHEFSRSATALREAWRVLKKGGFFYFQDLRRDLPWYLLRRTIPPKTVFQKLQFYSTRAAYTRREIAQLLRNIGIKNFLVHTRRVTLKLARRYTKIGVNLQQLREGFQSRYIVTAKKPKQF